VARLVPATDAALQTDGAKTSAAARPSRILAPQASSTELAAGDLMPLRAIDFSRGASAIVAVYGQFWGMNQRYLNFFILNQLPLHDD
jgi:hypothetical protein